VTEAPAVVPPGGIAPGQLQVVDDLIYDIGMNLCEDAAFYLKLGFRVLAVEADPRSCAVAAERFAQDVATGRLTIVNAAISNSRDPLVFYRCETTSFWSTASPQLRDQWRRSGAEFSEIEVPSVTVGEVLSAYGVPHYAKIDIEGYDLVCMEGFRKAGARPRHLSFEVDFYVADAMIDCALAMGYSRFALAPQSVVPMQRPPETPAEGRQTEHTFVIGASGLFGADLPHERVSARRIRARCRTIVWQHRASGLLSRLERLPGAKALSATARQRFLKLADDWYDIHAC
jgi:FkbM family methyltransferase